MSQTFSEIRSNINDVASGQKLKGEKNPQGELAEAVTLQDNELIKPFHITKTLTSAAAITAIPLIPKSVVPKNHKIYLQGFIAKVNGGTVWATTATVKIQDTKSSPVDLVTMAVAALTANAIVLPDDADITLEDAFALGSGGTAGEGLQLKGDADGTGSDLVVTLWGYIGK